MISGHSMQFHYLVLRQLKLQNENYEQVRVLFYFSWYKSCRYKEVNPLHLSDLVLILLFDMYYYFVSCLLRMQSILSQMKQEQVKNACNKSCSWIPIAGANFYVTNSICNCYWLVLDYYYMDTRVAEIIIACSFW